MTGLELGGQGLATLTNGNLAANEVQGGAIPALTRALASSGGRQSAKIELHSMVPYRTLLAVLRTLKAANVQKVGFVVRKGMTPALGVLVPDGFDVRDPSPDPVSFDAPYQRDWDTFVRTWDESFTRCAVDTGFQCTGVPDRAAEGGKVEIGLFTRQDAFVIDVRRFGTDDPPSRSSRSCRRRPARRRKGGNSTCRRWPAPRSTSAAPPPTCSRSRRSRSRSVPCAGSPPAASDSRRTR